MVEIIVEQYGAGIREGDGAWKEKSEVIYWQQCVLPYTFSFYIYIYIYIYIVNSDLEEFDFYK